MIDHVGLYGIPDDGSRYSPNGNTHDHGIASVRDGTCRAIELERYSRVKHDNRLGRFITQLLPLISDEQNKSVSSVNSFLGSGFESQDGSFRLKGRDMKISDIAIPTDCEINGQSVDAHIMCHEFAHIASCLPFIGTFDDNSLLFHFDGGAFNSSSSVWAWESGKPRLIEASWDELKDVSNNFNVNPLSRRILGLTAEDHLSMPGKLMGYASYGHRNNELENWLRSNHWFRGVDDTDELLQEIGYFFGKRMEKFDAHRQEFMDIAYALQHGFEESVLQYLGDVKERTGLNRLFYAGGSALNINANSRIANELGFDRFFIPPCCSDCGLAVGAAAWSYYVENGPLPTHPPFLGIHDVPPSYSHITGLSDSLAKGNCIGLVSGRSESGPRALGHRSIVARPDDVNLRIRVSEIMKRREWYRPVAPVLADIVAREILEDYQEGDELAQYMLSSYHVNPQYVPKLSGVIHVDGSVRAEVISKDFGALYDVLIDLHDRHGIFGLLLTSFNSKGEPIVETIDDAQLTASKIALDGLVIL